MNRLFIELYLDEDVHVLIAELVRSYGFTATTARQANKLGCDDAEQLAYAVREGKALLTHNRVDFERLATTYLTEGNEHNGIIIAVRRSPYEVARRVARILDKVTAEEMRNQLRYI
jgi:predicted nuclease of predicted toxin-antitoxin system